jgi:hypothetical protein
MLSSRVTDEMKTANLNDRRLDQRLRVVLTQLAEHPTASIPAACDGHAERTAADRLFDNGDARLLEYMSQAIRKATASCRGFLGGRGSM